MSEETQRLGDAGVRGQVEAEGGAASRILRPGGEAATKGTAPRTLPPVVVGISGASGAVLAQQTILRLGRAGYPVIATCSAAGRRVWREELDAEFDEFVRACQSDFYLEALDVEDIGASIASGRRPTLGMLVVPCSMDTLSAIAHGRSTNLLERAADVTLKEGRTLTLVPRESPLSPIHLENLWKLARLGVRIVLPVPAFYLRPATLDEVVDDVACRAIGTLGIRDLGEEMG
ncbi:MAG: UbiX family flavin prenyltransferase [Sphingomonadaceae bacterium]